MCGDEMTDPDGDGHAYLLGTSNSAHGSSLSTALPPYTETGSNSA